MNDTDQLIGSADAALYRAKAYGRDQVVAANSSSDGRLLISTGTDAKLRVWNLAPYLAAAT
ncbi:hypothetical protein [Asanoa siamensis]|uniref:Uncharacterized protein n=1 Tax=Asanoa siamensis TaxID=926357 RepID=A0ABQ4D3D8_9ACTN|nr:hypothetical protein [Asanoa siamensis]GIF78049.1 hypothetical protein Asi02nite_75670 [Asanoa siamensis]